MAFVVGMAVGIFPLLRHQHELTGSWWQSTYSPIDRTAPALGVVGTNLAYYVVGEGSSLLVCGVVATVLMVVVVEIITIMRAGEEVTWLLEEKVVIT